MLFRRSLILLLLFAGIGFAPLAARAATEDPAALVNDLIGRGLQTLKDKDMSEQEREQRFALLLRDDFDIPRIARYVLGRYWNGASDAERQAFATLFQQWVIRTYSSRLAGYSGEGVKVTGSRRESETGAVVTSQILRTGAPPIKLEWRMHKDGGTYRIVDVDVEGVSMALTEREEISAAVQRNGGTVAGLNHALEQRMVGEANASAAR